MTEQAKRLAVEINGKIESKVHMAYLLGVQATLKALEAVDDTADHSPDVKFDTVVPPKSAA
jgi:hypothetical protein